MTRLQAISIVFGGMVCVILAVLAFQHVGGYIPCKLCLEQRTPYYLAIPIAALALVAERFGWSSMLPRLALAVVGLLLLWTMALGVYHAGVEWQWWQGPSDCGATAGNISGNVDELLGDLAATRPPACDEAAGRFLGLSFAGWNVIVSLALAGIAFRGIFLPSRN